MALVITLGHRVLAGGGAGSFAALTTLLVREDLLRAYDASRRGISLSRHLAHVRQASGGELIRKERKKGVREQYIYDEFLLGLGCAGT